MKEKRRIAAETLIS